MKLVVRDGPGKISFCERFEFFVNRNASHLLRQTEPRELSRRPRNKPQRTRARKTVGKGQIVTVAKSPIARNTVGKVFKRTMTMSLSKEIP